MESSYKKKTGKKSAKKYNTDLCNNDMSFQDCELAILRHAVDESDEVRGQKIANGEAVKRMIDILEDFLVRKKLVCYGGTAINNILPKYAQFYNKDVEIPDYDFFSPNALDDAKELADAYYEAGFEEVEAKAGMHPGTYKVFVNFIPMADITFLHPTIYDSIKAEAITVAGIKYAPPNFLRMSMFLELSRPMGDTSRWEKVLKRLTLLNTHHPMSSGAGAGAGVGAVGCQTVDFQRKLETHTEDSDRIYFTVRDCFIELGVVFFGGYASSLYSRYMPKTQRRLIQRIPDFDVLAESPERTALIVRERLQELGIKDAREIKHDAIGEIVPRHIEIMVGKDTIAYIYEPIACHNYNTIHVGPKEINVATIDTMLSFYLAFLYAGAPYYHRERILCMAKFLFDVEQKNRLEQKGLLKRFSIQCYGKQPAIEDIRAEKTEKFKELVGKRGTHEYEEWFLKYNPAEKYQTDIIAKHEATKTTPALPLDSVELAKKKSIKSILKRRRTTKKAKKSKKVGFFF